MLVTLKDIEEFIQKRLAVYRADQQQIVRDTRAAERAAADHTGRWLFELLQNSEDAGASEVRIVIENDTIYVADNGCGLKPKSVSAICGTDFSDKTTGTIGHKGVGFKSVYEVSSNPQVLTVNGVGIEFSPDKAKKWFRYHSFNDGHVPYQWIPFAIQWDEELRQDLNLSTLVAYKTIVKLPGISQDKRHKVEQLLKQWSPHALFTFRHVRKIKAPDLEITVVPSNETWEMNDSRGITPKLWRVAQYKEPKESEKSVFEELLKPLGTDERKAILEDGVSILIATPLENDCVVPTKDYLPVHVFYPTEQIGPVRLLLHAEFLVKSDRTALIPIADSPLNAWIADKLARYVCKFVNDSYRTDKPSSHMAMLVPFGDRASHPVAEDLWQRIADKAKADLRLADVEGQQRLTIGEAKFISVSVRPDLARTLLQATNIRGQLLHRAFDDDKEARKALKELGCEDIHDQGLMETIAKHANSLIANTQWIWACWEWIASWIADEPYGDKHRDRIEQVKEMPMVPVDGRLLKASDLTGRIVTWKSDSQAESLPDWLPLTFVENWFRDRLQTVTEQKSSVKNLCAEIGIKEPGVDVIHRAVARAIEQYWEDKQGDPERFLRFILKQDWHETSAASSVLQRCPVPLSQPVQGESWAEARNAYFGCAWGNDLLADLYEGYDGVTWVQRIDDDPDKNHKVLAWLGCNDVPRIIKDRGPHNNGFSAYELPEECHAWRTREFGYTDRTPTVDSLSRLEGLTGKKLSGSQVCALLVLLAKHWTEYYKGHAQAMLSWFYYTTRSRTVPAFWWHEILHEIRPAMKPRSATCALVDCWMPNKQTERVIGDLLPVIDLDAFGNDKNTVRDWLVSEVGLRTRIEQLTVEEWNKLLSKRILEKAPADRLVSDERLRDKVTGWYEACLETVTEQENVPQKTFELCPLLCQKADLWQYVIKEPRYLNDDNELATAFARDVWLFHIPDRIANNAVKYLAVLRISESVQVHVTTGEPKSPLPEGLMKQLNESLPYVWAWRSSQSKQSAEKLCACLKGLKVYVVPTLKVNLNLNGVHHEVERRWHVIDDTILLHRDHANEAELAQALAKMIDVKSEADFYENLLRCNEGYQRKEKLLIKGISDAEVERFLREYSRRTGEEEQEHQRGDSIVSTKEDAGSTTSGLSSAPGNERQPQIPASGEQQGKTPEKPQEPVGVSKQLLRIKDASTVEYVIGMPPQRGDGCLGGGGDVGASHEEHTLTDEEKSRLEKAGRDIARRELTKIGYMVEEMPPNNPGFDLRATKTDEELRVEVKAHTGRATVVDDFTPRQYKEYLGQQGYRWELWNVEHISEDDTKPVMVTRYDNIPDDALDARIFRLDLKKCQSPANLSSAPNKSQRTV